MFFSVVTVTRDNLAGLRRTHESLKGQSCRDFEWIAVDGDSTDGTREYLASADSSWISEPDRGIYDAMNKGMARAGGDYLLFLNAGDALTAPDVLELLAENISSQSPPPDFVYGDSVETDPLPVGACAPPFPLPEGRGIKGEGDWHYKPARSHKKALRGLFTHHQAMLYRREMLRDMRYDERYKIAADYDFTLRVLRETENILYCPFPVCVFESGGVSQVNAAQGRREQYAIRRTLGVDPLTNALVYGLQAAAWTIRIRAPGLYRLLKSCGSNGRGSRRSQAPPPRPESPA